MGDLLPSCLGLDDAAKSKQKHCLIINISEWLQSFAVYVSVIARKQSQRVTDLMGYQLLILVNIRMTAGWHMTDVFAKMLLFSRNCSWSNIDTTLWLLAFSGQARTNHCNICFSPSHTSKDCELASGTHDTNLHHQASTFTAVKDIVTSNTTGGLFAISGTNRDLRHTHIPIVVMTMFITSVCQILKPVISITKPYSVLTVTIIASYFPVSPKPHLHHQNH